MEPYCERDASRAGLLEMRPFGEAKSISGHQTLQLMRRPYGVKGSVYVVTLPAFQRCLEDGPDAAERGDQREGADSPPAGGLETAISRHITTYRQHRRDPGRQPGVRGSIVPAASRTSYSSFLKVGVRDLFSATEKNKRSRFDSAQPNDTSNTNDLCLECVARSLLKLYRQQHGASFLLSRRGNRAASA